MRPVGCVCRNPAEIGTLHTFSDQSRRLPPNTRPKKKERKRKKEKKRQKKKSNWTWDKRVNAGLKGKRQEEVSDRRRRLLIDGKEKRCLWTSLTRQAGPRLGLHLTVHTGPANLFAVAARRSEVWREVGGREGGRGGGGFSLSGVMQAGGSVWALVTHIPPLTTTPPPGPHPWPPRPFLKPLLGEETSDRVLTNKT